MQSAFKKQLKYNKCVISMHSYYVNAYLSKWFTLIVLYVGYKKHTILYKFRNVAKG